MFVGERGVAQAITERIERCTQGVPIARGESGSVLRRLRKSVIVVEREFGGIVRPAYRKVSGRIGVAKEDISDAVAALASGIPGFENRGNVLGSPGDVERTSIDYHEHYGFASGGDSFEQLLLASGNVET